jgi:hypothetical protein
MSVWIAPSTPVTRSPPSARHWTTPIEGKKRQTAENKATTPCEGESTWNARVSAMLEHKAQTLRATITPRSNIIVVKNMFSGYTRSGCVDADSATENAECDGLKK